MRIAFFAETYYPFVSGVSKSLDSFGSYLVSKGFEVHLVCPRTDKPDGYLGMRIHPLPTLPSLIYPGVGVTLPILRDLPRVDIVHTHGTLDVGLLGMRTARKQRVPLVSTFHTMIPLAVEYITTRDVFRKPLERLAWFLIRKYYSRCDLVITPSEFVRRVIVEKMGYGGESLVIPTGVDVEALKPIPKKRARRYLGIDENEKIMLYLGRIAREKRIEVAIDALARLKDWKMLVAGRGPWLENVKKHTERVGVTDRIEFLGFIPESEKNLYYSASDFFVMPSMYDTQGVVVLEAMACGCPVVAARAMALPEFVKHESNGLLFRPGSPHSLARTVSEHEESLDAMRKRARKTALEYSVENMGERLVGAYESLLSGG